MKIALLADFHYAQSCPLPERRGQIADILLKRAVRRLNRLVCPDVTLVLGDLLDDGSGSDARERLTHLRSILDGLENPYLAIPGNHDGDPDLFYSVFEQPREIEGLAGARFLTFLDKEEPRHNASRATRDIDRIRAARSGFKGLIVSMQHVCLFPPGEANAPYNYTNAPAIVEAMRQAGQLVSVSGHFHKGADDVRQGDLLFVNASALCEPPFAFTVLVVDEQGHVETERHQLAMPRELGLFDGHMHTQLAYCSENMDVAIATGLAADFGLRGLAFTEHSGQLYFNRKEYWGKQGLREGMAAARPEDNRMGQYHELRSAYARDGVRFGLEADCDYTGKLLIAPEDRKRFDYIVGAIHGLSSLQPDTGVTDLVRREFLFLVESIAAQKAAVLAHPFREFGRSGIAVPEDLFLPVAQLLRRYGVAAEINYHVNEPPAAFIRICLELGVKFSLASDAHNLYEIGDFAYHLALLQEAGFNGSSAEDLQSILI